MIIEDQVITSKANYDNLLSENARLKAELEKSTIKIRLANGTHRWNGEILYEFENVLTFGTEVPGEIVKLFESFNDEIKRAKEDLTREKVNLIEATSQAKMVIANKERVSYEISKKIQSLPKLVKWLFKIKPE